MNLTQRQISEIILLAITIFVGLATRFIHINSEIINHYLGDALYAVMFFLILSIFWQDGSAVSRGLITMGFMLCLELFQLTNIPSHFSESGNSFLKLLGFLLGTKFEWLELLSYAVGIAAAVLIELMSVVRK